MGPYQHSPHTVLVQRRSLQGKASAGAVPGTDGSSLQPRCPRPREGRTSYRVGQWGMWAEFGTKGGWKIRKQKHPPSSERMDFVTHCRSNYLSSQLEVHMQKTCQKQKCEHEFRRALRELLAASSIVPHPVTSSLELLLGQVRTETATERRLLTKRDEQGKRQERKFSELRRGEGGRGGDPCYCQCVSHNYLRARKVIKLHYSHITWNKLFNAAFLRAKYCDNFRDHNLIEQ